jgi:flagellar assembly protein FliH
MSSSERPAFGEPVASNVSISGRTPSFYSGTDGLDPRPIIDPNREAGFAAGYTAGWSVGYHAASVEVAAQRKKRDQRDAQRRQKLHDDAVAAIDVLSRAANAARQRTLPVIEEASRDLVLKSVELAEAIIGRQLADARASAQVALDKALADPELCAEAVQIRLSQQDYQVIQTVNAESEGAFALPEGVVLTADSSLMPGDVMCVLTEGYLDARISTALARVRQTIIDTAESGLGIEASDFGKAVGECD